MVEGCCARSTASACADGFAATSEHVVSALIGRSLTPQLQVDRGSEDMNAFNDLVEVGAEMFPIAGEEVARSGFDRRHENRDVLVRKTNPRGKVPGTRLIHDLQPLCETMETSPLLRRFDVPISFDDGIRRREQGDARKLPQREKAAIRSPSGGDEDVRVEENPLAHARGGGSCGMLSGSSPNFRTARRAAA